MRSHFLALWAWLATSDRPWTDSSASLGDPECRFLRWWLNAIDGCSTARHSTHSANIGCLLLDFNGNPRPSAYRPYSPNLCAPFRLADRCVHGDGRRTSSAALLAWCSQSSTAWSPWAVYHHGRSEVIFFEFDGKTVRSQVLPVQPRIGIFFRTCSSGFAGDGGSNQKSDMMR